VEPSPHDTSSSLEEQIDSWRARALSPGPRARRIILLTSVLFLIAGAAVAVQSRPEVFEEFSWPPLLFVALLCVPTTVSLNAVGYLLSGRMVGRRIAFLNAMEIAIISATANLLPLPGGIIARIAALKAEGASVREGTWATFLVGLVWMTLTLAYGGIWLTLLGALFLGLPLAVVGTGGLAVALFLVARTANVYTAILTLLVKTGLVLTDTLRILLCLFALGTAVEFSQAAALTISSSVGSMVAFVPAGMGIREAVSGLLSPLVGIPPALGFLSATLNRVVGLCVLAPIATALALRTSGTGGR
jgi:hypothetical protein